MSEEFKVYNINTAPAYDIKFDKVIDEMIVNAPKRAKRFLESYEDMLTTLSIFPESGVEPDDERLRMLRYRYKVVDDFLIYYTFFNDTVTLMLFFNQRENHKQYIFL